MAFSTWPKQRLWSLELRNRLPSSISRLGSWSRSHLNRLSLSHEFSMSPLTANLLSATTSLERCTPATFIYVLSGMCGHCWLRKLPTHRHRICHHVDAAWLLQLHTIWSHKLQHWKIIIACRELSGTCYLLWWWWYRSSATNLRQSLTGFWFRSALSLRSRPSHTKYSFIASQATFWISSSTTLRRGSSARRPQICSWSHPRPRSLPKHSVSLPQRCGRIYHTASILPPPLQIASMNS